MHPSRHITAPQATRQQLHPGYDHREGTAQLMHPRRMRPLLRCRRLETRTKLIHAALLGARNDWWVFRSEALPDGVDQLVDVERLEHHRHTHGDEVVL